MSARTLPSVWVAATLAIGLIGVTQAAPLGAAQPNVDVTQLSTGLIVKSVTAVGMAHRSARRTARRVGRRHGY